MAFKPDNLRKAVYEAITRDFESKVEKIKLVCEEAIDAETAQMMHYLVQCLGKTEAPDLGGATQRWAALSAPYIKRKGNSVFFRKEAELIPELIGEEGSSLEIFGPVDVRIERSSSVISKRTIPGKSIDPNIQGFVIRMKPFQMVSGFLSANPGDHTANYDMANYMGHYLTRGLDKFMNLGPRKEKTSNRAFRPILVPVLIYFIQDRFPAAIRKALSEAGLKVVVY